MQILLYSILAGHFALLFFLSLSGLHRLSMVWRWRRYKDVRPQTPQHFAQLPRVTVQIPIYNERFVAQRIIDACAALDYPSDKLHIQIVDDSTDDTRELIAQRVLFHRAQGVDIEQVCREHRQGFKAGALKEAMETAKGDFIAIFDADFVPPTDILRNNLNYFTDPKIAMLQFRWEHLNRFNGGFTEGQAIMLDAHFALEQQIRYASGCLFNFNGTAGIWRKQAIIDAGNWSADTLTEDLDLSYRAQMAGWQVLYLNDVTCPGELPADMNAFRSQQHRWAKGGIQVMRKLLKTIWQKPYGFGKKLEASFHLCNNLAYLLMLTDTLLFLVPSLLIRENLGIDYIVWLDLPLLLLASGGHLVYLFFSQVALGHSKRRALALTPRLMLMGIQLAFNNARAGFEAIRGQQSEFIRTPKSGDVHRQPSPKPARQYQVQVPRSAFIEFGMALIYTLVLGWAVSNEIWLLLPFLLLLIAGFASTALGNLKYHWALRSS